jgi:hypothetical protein
VRLINVPIKVAWVDGELLLEAHPPVDAQGQSFEPDLDQFSDLLRAAVGDTTVAIHWDYAREVLQKADGVIATVGLEADASALDNGPADPKAPAVDAVAQADHPAALPPAAQSTAAQSTAAQSTAVQSTAALPTAAPAPAAAQLDAPSGH